MREKYNIDLGKLVEIAKEGEVEKKEISVPVEIFRQGISPAEALCKYFKENLGLRFSQIADIINRNERTVWINYRDAMKKMKEKIKLRRKALISVSAEIFADRRLSILEALVSYFKKNGLRNSEIAEIIGKDQRNIWTLYSRALKKSA